MGIGRVHLDFDDGSDDSNGTAPDTAVKTLEKALELLAHNGQIVLESPFVIDNKMTISLAGKGDASIVRGESQRGPMILLEEGADLTLEHVVFDGKNELGALSSIIWSIDPNAALTLNDGAVLQNNTSPSGHSGSAIAGWEGLELTMNEGSIIQGNSTTKTGYGTVFLANEGTFTMNGGEIRDNRANRGGGVALLASKMEMTGGSIADNYAYAALSAGDGYAGAVYLSNWESISGPTGTSNSVRAGDTSFSMKGGTLVGNTAEDLGGAVVTFPMTGTGDIEVSMSKGSMIGNSVEQGNAGAVALYCLFDSAQTRFDMSGGEISGNAATGQAGGVYMYGMKGDTAKMSGGVISANKADQGGGVAALVGSVWNMSGGSVENNEAHLGGGGYLSAGSSWVMSNGTIAGNNASADQMATKGDGIYQGGTLRVSGDAILDSNNDVYLPKGRIIDVVDRFDGATSELPISVTSEECVVEPVDVSTAGTKLVKYHEAAGGVDAAREAHQRQRYVPSKKMLAKDSTLYIGKSMESNQLDYMTYIEAPAAYEVVYEYHGYVPDGAVSQLPEPREYTAGEFVDVEPQPVVEGYRFSGWNKHERDFVLEDGSFVMPERDVLLCGSWEKVAAPDGEDQDQETEPEEDSAPKPDDGPDGDPSPKPEPEQSPDVNDDSDGDAETDRETDGGAQEYDDVLKSHEDVMVVLPKTGDTSMQVVAALFLVGGLTTLVSLARLGRRMRW